MIELQLTKIIDMKFVNMSRLEILVEKSQIPNCSLQRVHRFSKNSIRKVAEKLTA